MVETIQKKLLHVSSKIDRIESADLVLNEKKDLAIKTLDDKLQVLMKKMEESH